MTCFACIFRRRTEHQQHDVLNEGNEIIKLYSYSELKSATNSFSSSLKLGVGGFGSVYKGILRDGTVVAIKVLSSESNQRARQFLTEMIVVAGIIHENLVRLYGCCVEEPHRMLVYDYIENNSIAKTLLGSSQSNIQFNWSSRVKICIGVARGLAFLHEEVRPHVVHRDIKASNILLDKDLTPKISDFGLAKLMPSNMTHISTRVAGTIGYLAPEYASRGQVTRKSDVYSYGVLLLEIVTGRCNTNNNKMPDFEDQYLPEMPQDITNGLLVSQTWTLYECGKLVNIIDNSLIDGLDAEEACRFLKVGLLCTQEDMKLRPSMSTVIRMLTGRKDVDSGKITKPGMITDLMELKIRSNKKDDPTNRSFVTSSGQDTPSSSGTSTHAYTNDFYSSI